MHARPTMVPSLFNHGGPKRIELDVAVGGKQVRIAGHTPGFKASVQRHACASMTMIESLGVGLPSNGRIQWPKRSSVDTCQQAMSAALKAGGRSAADFNVT